MKEQKQVLSLPIPEGYRLTSEYRKLGPKEVGVVYDGNNPIIVKGDHPAAKFNCFILKKVQK